MKQIRKSKTDYKDKIFHHKLTIVYRVLLVIVLVAALAAAVKIYLANQVYTKFEMIKTIDKVGTSDGVFRKYQDNLLTYSKDGISAYDKDGKQLWNQTYEMQEPIVVSRGGYVAVADYKGSVLYLIGPSGNATTVETNLPILDLDVSSSGIAVAALQDDATIYLRMFSATGDVISEIKTSMQKSGYPLAFSISPDNIKVGVSYLKAEGGKINASLAFYNFGDVGQNETDNLVSGYDYAGELFPLLFYPNEDNALAVGDKRVLILKGKQKPTLQTEIELDDEVQSVFYNGTNFALVFRNTEQDGGYSIRVYDMNGRKKMTETIDFEYTDLIVENDRILVYNQNQLVIYGLNGVKKYEGELGGTIRAIVPTSSDTKLLVVLEDSIQLIKLR